MRGATQVIGGESSKKGVTFRRSLREETIEILLENEDDDTGGLAFHKQCYVNSDTKEQSDYIDVMNPKRSYSVAGVALRANRLRTAFRRRPPAHTHTRTQMHKKRRRLFITVQRQSYPFTTTFPAHSRKSSWRVARMH